MYEIMNKETKKIYGLLGRNIGYSLSPAMHNAAFQHFNIPDQYMLFDIEDSRVESFLKDTVSKGNIGGINITIPYKVKVKEILESNQNFQLDKTAILLGVINTIKKDGTRLIGYNTDGPGLYESLAEDLSFNPAGKKIFICGSGGAGRAICLYLASLEAKAPKAIYIYDVDAVKLAVLKNEFDVYFSGRGVLCEALKNNELALKISECDLAVNATPIGTKETDILPFPVDSVNRNACLYDLVYSRETLIVRTLAKKGIRAVNGLGMLANQGAIAFHLWTGAPLGEVKKIMRQALEKKIKSQFSR
ncbi:shikimate 5-dehydrogenase [Candidatus Omnitrophus magneticus]|uniref:Shikimate 5-dehydrogenase n=1 Tax=Candidatus Omnitrophus magneticus TaxID=1609969 RepID=A0A0F0CL82_9BACT|nr:shikimate 5-dehydrogenase [Candidatus Omnitrophus magneticus]